MSIKSFLTIVPIMFYYLIESFFVSIFVSVAWKFILQPQFSIHLTYLHWVFIIWIVKVILFDPIKLAANLNNQIIVEKIKDEIQAEVEES